MRSTMLVLSHRGFHTQLPENTLPAFQAAVDLGVDGIETDLRVTADNKLILYHDRLAPDGRLVANVTHPELEKLRGHAIPLAHAALELWPGLLWNLEIKTPAAMPAAMALIGRFASTHRLLITSFWHPLVQQVAQQCNVPCGWLVSHRPQLGENAHAGPPLSLAPPPADRMNTLVWNYEFLDPACVQQAAEAGYYSYCYGIGTAAEHAVAQSWGLDAIITDWPDFMLAR